MALGLDPEAVTDLRRAALLHDLGRVASPTGSGRSRPTPAPPSGNASASTPTRPSGSWPAPGSWSRWPGQQGCTTSDKTGPATTGEPPAARVPAAARVLAAADAFQAMTQDRPHRPGMAPEAAPRRWPSRHERAAWTPRVSGRSSRRPGSPPPRVRSVWPAGLSDREIDVLRLVARGLSNRAIAGRLVISPRTAEHHVQHIYTKIGASTRAAAAMFAMEHGLLRD